MTISTSINELENRTGYVFSNKDLLATALTHSSYSNEKGMAAEKCNERLEFLGDAVLGLVIGRYLYEMKPGMPEGKMTKLKAGIVCRSALMECAVKIGLRKHLLLGRGEELTGGREKPSVLSCAFEALIGAVYIDAGFSEAYGFVLRNMSCVLNGPEQRPLELPEQQAGLQQEQAVPAFVDYKSALQEYLQKSNSKSKMHGNEVSYRIIGETGPDHDKRFIAEALFNGSVLGSGEGKSKKEAEQEAAMQAISHIDGINKR